MAALGADVQATSGALVDVIEELKERRAEVDIAIGREEEERAKVVAEIRALNERLKLLDDSLSRKIAARAEFDKTIQQTSQRFAAILETSRTLLSTVRQESAALKKTTL